MRASTVPSVLLAFLALLTPAVTRQGPTSYCKCICFQNSTIIPLNSPPQQPNPQPPIPPPFTPSPSPSPDEDLSPPTSDDPSGQTSEPGNDGGERMLRRSLPSPSTPCANVFGDPSLRLSAYYARKHAYTIVGRQDEDEDEGAGEGAGGSGRQHHRTLTCSDCNRAFCLDYNLPICKGAKEEDVFTSCFQRDSVKDETVVLLFILLTASLLSWAVLKPYIDRFRDSNGFGGRGGGGIAAFVPVALGGGNNNNSNIPISSDRSGGARGVGNSNNNNNGGSRAGRRPFTDNNNNSLLPRTESASVSAYRDDNNNFDFDTRRSVRDDRNPAESRGASIARQGGLNS